MNGIKTTIGLSVLLGTILGGVAMADLSGGPTTPHLVSYCGQDPSVRTTALDRAATRLRQVMAARPSLNLAESERLWLARSAALVNSLDERQLDCVMMQAGFILKSDGPQHLVYSMYREKFPFNPEKYMFVFAKSDDKLRLKQVVVDSGAS